MNTPHYPSLYQINTRVWLNGLAADLGRSATLDDFPDEEIDRLAKLGFDWIWLLSVWQTGPLGLAISRSHGEWRADFERTLPDLREDDIVGSGFSIASYTVADSLGGDAALARLRKRLAKRGLKLMLDFVPNHMGLDHPWVSSHPEYFVSGTEADLARAPQNYRRFSHPGGDRILAYGRDPYFDGWPDTLQLNYGNPSTQAAMRAELLRIATQCDGVRCDMAMLILPDVFERTWGVRAAPFWADTIQAARRTNPGFCLMAEVYWDLEWNLQSLGFDYCYDKRLYDRLREGHARPVREHFYAGPDFQDKLARFLENHDEPRAAATFPPGQHAAAAVLTFLAPGLRFFHQGQLEGRLKRISPHLGRAPLEPVIPEVQAAYMKLLGILRDPVVRDGRWSLLASHSAWAGNGSHDSLIAFWWEKDGERRLVVVNYAPHSSQGHVPLPIPELAQGRWEFADLWSDGVYPYGGDDLQARGVYIDLAPWHAHIFQVRRIG